MKFFKSCLLGVLFIFVSAYAWAAGTIVIASDKTANGLKGKELREIVYTVTFGSDASSPANTALDSITWENGLTVPTMGGWWIYRIDIYYGATGPTDNTDMYLYKATGATKSDLLGGNGVDSIDNATNTTIYPATMTQGLLGDEIFSFANNAVNNAVCTIVVSLYR